MSAVAEVNAQPLQRDHAWYAARVGKITASRVGAILALSKYRSAEDVMRGMVREALGAPSEFTGNDATRYGQAHERDALDAYTFATGRTVEPMPLIVHPDYPWLAASPDGAVGMDCLVECKAPFRAKYTEPSDEYLAQVQLQLACTGRAFCDFVIWREGEEPIIKRIPRNLVWLDQNIDALRAFHDRYESIIASKDLAAPYLAPLVRDDDAWREAAAQYLAHKEAADTEAKLADHYRATLAKLAPGGASGCGVNLVRVEREGSVQWSKAFKALLPDADVSRWRGKPTITYTVRVEK